jgi:hypothetical protein
MERGFTDPEQRQTERIRRAVSAASVAALLTVMPDGRPKRAPLPSRGSTSLSATLGSCNRLPLLAPALAANGIPISDRRCPAISAKEGSR